MKMQTNSAPIRIKVLILPKFTIDTTSGSIPDEATLYYEAFCAGGAEYDIRGSYAGNRLYIKDGVALYATGVGKVNAAMSLHAVLTDPRFDCSDAYIISTGCAGSARGTTVMGDVFVVTAAVDGDLGYRADARDLADSAGTTWFREPKYDDTAVKILDPALMERVYALVKDIPLQTTENTRKFMAHAFDNAAWATRDPKVLRGTTVTSDTYWKGEYDHRNALLMTETYGCPDPFAVSEMEDIALAVVLDRLGMLDRLIVLRVSVNMDVFMNGATPEQLWSRSFFEGLESDSNPEVLDIFGPAMRNNFRVGREIVRAILEQRL